MQRLVEHLSLRMTPEEREALQRLAQKLERNQADSIRYLIRQADRQFQQLDGSEQSLTGKTTYA
jgi:predicted DNA-binding protein